METVFVVPEMHCGACEKSIRRALAGTDGVVSVSVDLGEKRVAVRFDEPGAVPALRSAIEAAGFDVLDG